MASRQKTDNRALLFLTPDELSDELRPPFKCKSPRFNCSATPALETRLGCSIAGTAHYTGLPLDWTLISKFDNKDAKAGRSEYLRRFGNLPTVDHATDGNGALRFVICSWRVNDAKSHLSEGEFCELCEQVLAHRKAKGAACAQLRPRSHNPQV